MRLFKFFGLGLLAFVVSGDTISSTLVCQHGVASPQSTVAQSLNPSQQIISTHRPILPPELSQTVPLSELARALPEPERPEPRPIESPQIPAGVDVPQPNKRSWQVNGQIHETEEVYDSEGHLHQKQRWIDANGNRHQTDNWADQDGKVYQCHKWQDSDGCVHESHQTTDLNGTVTKKHLKKDQNGVVETVEDSIVQSNTYLQTEQIKQHHYHSAQPAISHSRRPPASKIKHAPNCPLGHLQRND